MKNFKFIVLITAAFFLISGCTKKTIVPGIDVSRLDAEQAIAVAQSEVDEAQEVGADVAKPKDVLENARKLLGKENYYKAKSEADRAGKMARRLKEEILAKIRAKEDALSAIERASKIISEAESLGGDVTEPESMLARAKAEFDNENYGRAIELADKAYELARDILDLLKTDTYVVGTWEADKACLWNIAGKERTYNDPWKWKRIYNANKDKIMDSDLIYPNQILKIPRK